MLGFLNGRVLLGIDFPWTSAHPKQGINSTETSEGGDDEHRCQHIKTPVKDNAKDHRK